MGRIYKDLKDFDTPQYFVLKLTKKAFYQSMVKGFLGIFQI
jgi:hypothetical protein